MSQDPAAPVARPATPLGLIGIGLALLFLVATALSPLAPGDRDLADDASLQQAFVMNGPPLGWTRVSARKLKDGREIYLFEDPDAPEPDPLPVDPPPEKKPEPKKAQGSRGGGGGRWGKPKDKKRWSRLAASAPGQAPRQLALIRIPPKRAEQELKALFTDLSYKDLADVGYEGGVVPLEAWRYPWASYDAPIVIMRHLYNEDVEPGGEASEASAVEGEDAEEGGGEEDKQKPTYHETIRINLTIGQEPWVAILSWDQRKPASRDWARMLLSEVAPRSGSTEPGQK